MKKFPSIFLALFCLLISSSLFAQQNNRFSANLVAGLNFFPQQGNNFTDFLGLNAGVVGVVHLTKESQLNLELLFSRKGEYFSTPFSLGSVQEVRMLNHLVIPLNYELRLSANSEKGYDNLSVQFGGALLYLLDRLEDENGNDISEYRVYDTVGDLFLVQAGLSYFFTEHLGVNLRTSTRLKSFGTGSSVALKMVYRWR